MKKLVSFLLSLCLMLGSLALPAKAADGYEMAKKFKDIPENHSYLMYLYYSLENELFFGTSQNTFEMRRDIDQGEAITVLGRIHEKISGSKMPASSGQGERFYSQYAAWAREQGFLNGMSGWFAPEKAVTREELALLFYRYIEFSGIRRTFPVKSEFADVEQASPMAREAIRYLEPYEIFAPADYSRTEDQILPLFGPQETVSRGEATRLFVILYQKLTYPIDGQTPRLKYYHTPIYGKGSLLPWPLEEGESKILSDYQAYSELIGNIPPGALQGEEGPLLEVNDSTFADHNIVAVDIPSTPSDFPDGKVACVVSGDTAEITFVPLETPGAVDFYVPSYFYLLEVPKPVTKVTVKKYFWVCDFVEPR